MDESQIDAALRSDTPALSLRAVVRGWLDRGVRREDARRSLEQLRASLQAQGREDDEDAVLDVMDFLEGWCSPDLRL